MNRADGDDPLALLRRWEHSGATWELLARTPSHVTLSLRRCDGGEEAQRLTSGDARLRAYVDSRVSDAES